MPPENKNVGKAGDWAKAVREAAPYLGIGTSLALTVLIGIGGGYWIDRRYGTAPAFVLVGAVFGLVAAAWNFWKMYRAMVDRKR